ncbi:GDSL-type esterase/lipase family protein [Ignavibacteriales bacterium]
MKIKSSEFKSLVRYVFNISLMFVVLLAAAITTEAQNNPKKKPGSDKVNKDPDKKPGKKNPGKPTPKKNKKGSGNTPKKSPPKTGNGKKPAVTKPNLNNMYNLIPKDTSSETTFGLIEKYASEYNGEANQILNSASLEHIFSKMNLLQNGTPGKVKILHIGDSHVQPDYFASWIRTELQKKFGCGGYGLFYPYALSNIYSRMGLYSWSDVSWTSKRNLTKDGDQKTGVSGYSIRTASPSWQINWGVLPFNTFDNRSNKLTVFHTGSGTRLEVLPLQPVTGQGNSVITSYDETAGVTPVQSTGDTTLNGWTATSFLLPLATNNFALKSSSNSEKGSEFTFYGGTMEEDEASGIIYHEAGVGASQLPLFTQSTHFFRQLEFLDPDLVIISLGTNESYSPEYDTVWYEQKVTELIQTVRSKKPETSFIFMTPPDILYAGKYPKYTEPIIRIYHRVSEKENVAIWDWNKIMGGKNSMKKWVSNKLAQKDNIHFTPAGYRLLAALFTRSFLDAYEGYNSPKESDESVN